MRRTPFGGVRVRPPIMNLLGRLALLFVIVPILELMLLIQVGQWVGLPLTLGLVLFTGVTGAWLARAEGLRVFFRFQQELGAGQLPGQALLDGLSVLVGGAFLLTPGILTDVAGFALLIPLTRRWIQGRVRKRLERSLATGQIRVVSMGPGGFGFGGAGGAGSAREKDEGTAGGAGGAARGGGSDPYEGRDPSQGIEVGGPGSNP